MAGGPPALRLGGREKKKGEDNKWDEKENKNKTVFVHLYKKRLNLMSFNHSEGKPPCINYTIDTPPPPYVALINYYFPFAI